MPTDLHFICQHRVNWTQKSADIFDTGRWYLSEAISEQAVGGRVYLHEKKSLPAWHGGTITAWRRSDLKRRVFLLTSLMARFGSYARQDGDKRRQLFGAKAFRASVSRPQPSGALP